MRGVLDDDSHLGKLVADFVGAGEVARGARGGPLVHEALNLVVARGADLGGGQDIEHRVRLAESIGEEPAHLFRDPFAIEGSVDLTQQRVKGAESARSVEVVAEGLAELAAEVLDDPRFEVALAFGRWRVLDLRTTHRNRRATFVGSTHGGAAAVARNA